MSLNSGIFPTNWKKANIIPLQKNGDKTDVNNLRPISLLPLPGKLLERIIHTKLSSYLEGYNLLDSKQNGFRKNRSTIGTVVDLTDDVLQGLNNKLYTIASFIDLRKAFDTVSHDILKQKILKFGFSENITDWISNYLSNRQQRCAVNGYTSDYLSITCGVPQGSIIGPLLFLIYVNDITKNLHNSTVRLYADDTVIYVTHESEDVAHGIISDELDIVTRWCNSNQLTMNLSKTKMMLYGTRTMLKKGHYNDVLINGTALQYVHNFHYLGVKLDDKLNFEAHANECIKMVSYKLYLLTKIRGYIDKEQAITIFKSKIIPYFDYGDIFLYKIQVKTKNTLDRLQNCVLRIVLGKDTRYNGWRVHQEAKTPFLNDRRICHLENFAYKRHLNERYVDNPKRPLRIHDAPVLREHRSNNGSFERSILYQCTKHWNILPSDVRNIQTYNSFKLNRKNNMMAAVN